ncbi:MAG: helix-turn-helix transcriptional regulator [Verrucomicrobiota bacterium]
MNPSLLEKSSRLNPPENYFSGYTPDELPIPQNILLFSRTKQNDLQRKSFDGYPHHRFVLAFNLQTAGTITADGIPWKLHPNEAYLIFPYQFHQFIDLDSTVLNWLFITFELESSDSLEAFRHRILKLDQTARAILERIIDDFRSAHSERAARRLTLTVANLINHLREQLELSPKTQVAQRRRRSTSLLAQIQKGLKTEPGEMMTVSRLSRRLSMSESNLRAKFRQQFNISLGAYLKNYRAHQAILLMRNPRMSLTEIAFELGFTTLAAFSRFFTQSIGSTPRNYRRYLRY